MSEIRLNFDVPSGEMVKIHNVKVYDFFESTAASKYPMQVVPDPSNDALTETAKRLAQSDMGSGHDNWLCGIRVAFDISITAKCMVELERYHFMDIVSCNSTMHRITRFNLDEAYCKYVDSRMVSIMTELVSEYNEDPIPEKYLRILYSNPNGFVYTMRIDTNYRQLKTVYNQRRDHRLPEWREICEWITTLPHAELIVGDKKGIDEASSV